MAVVTILPTAQMLALHAYSVGQSPSSSRALQRSQAPISHSTLGIAEIIDELTFRNTEELCSHLGTALLASQAICTSPEAGSTLQPKVNRLAELALQLACLFSKDASSSAAAASPAASTPGRSTTGNPKLESLLHATAAHVGHCVSEQAGEEEETRLPMPVHAAWLPSAVAILDAGVRCHLHQGCQAVQCEWMGC